MPGLRRTCALLAAAGVLVAGCSAPDEPPTTAPTEPTTTTGTTATATTGTTATDTAGPTGPTTPEVRWELPQEPGYEQTPAPVPGVLQLASVEDACLLQLADDEVAERDVEDLVDRVLAELGAEQTDRSRTELAGHQGPLEAVEVGFTASLDQEPTRGVMLLAVPPGHGVLLSVTYACTGGELPRETWERLRDGTRVELVDRR